MQVAPVHVAVDALVVLHTSPHALQFDVVARVVQVTGLSLLQSVSRHVHEPFWQSGAG